VDVEVVGDDVHVQEPKDEQRESDHADECEHNQDEARESVGREMSRATWKPPALCARRGRFGGHPIRILRRERNGPRPGEGASDRRKDRQASVTAEPDPVQGRERRDRPFVLEPPELAGPALTGTLVGDRSHSLKT
jgi:hypothetical protein